MTPGPVRSAPVAVALSPRNRRMPALSSAFQPMQVAKACVSENQPTKVR